MGAVDRCLCMGLVAPTEVYAEYRQGTAVVLRWRHGCGFEGSTLLQWGEYRRFAALRRATLQALERHIDADLAVGSFEADLSAVDTAADLIEIWDEQERWNPRTVVREP